MPIFIAFGLAQPEIEAESTVSVADLLKNDFDAHEQNQDNMEPKPIQLRHCRDRIETYFEVSRTL